jgi:hypothetical protein
MAEWRMSANGTDRLMALIAVPAFPQTLPLSEVEKQYCGDAALPQFDLNRTTGGLRVVRIRRCETKSLLLNPLARELACAASPVPFAEGVRKGEH